MFHDLCTVTGALILNFCRSTGQMMLLFLDTLAKIRSVSIKETLRQMALLGADSLPIVLLTMLCTGMVFSVQTAKEFVELGASGTVGGIVAIAMGRELVPVLTGVVVAGRIGAAIAAELGTMKVTEQIDALDLTKHVTGDTVPTFIWHSIDDPVVDARASTKFILALQNEGINCEYHLFDRGGHGLGLANKVYAHSGEEVLSDLAIWTTLADNWMSRR